MTPEHPYTLPPGSRLRHYRIVRLLGHGGFGLTYLAEDTNLHRKVAIKELLPVDFAIRQADGATVVARTHRDQANFEWARQRFVEEGRTLAALQHPSILHVYDIFELHGTAYLVTAFIDGPNLEDWLRNPRGPSPLNQEDLLTLANSLLDALRRVHAQGFLHRDVKPENILLDEKTGQPVLIDFGNARMATGEKTSTMTAVLSRGYAPLEQYQSNVRQGPFTDVYALGAVLYRAITGAPPQDALDRLDTDKVQALSEKAISGYSREFLATIDKALKMKRDDRWQNCQDWRTALGARDQSAPHRTGFAPRHRKGPPAIVTIGLLTLAGVGIGLWINRNSPPPAPSIAASENAPSASSPAASPPVYKPPATPAAIPSLKIAVARPSPPLTPQSLTPAPTPAQNTSAAPETLAPVPHRGFRIPPAFTPPPTPISAAVKPASATKEAPFVNSLGMQFAPVEITGGLTNGKRILFSVWDTRVRDYAEYARASGFTPETPDFRKSWNHPAVNFIQGSTHPVVEVSWDNAVAFCKWLTEKERASGGIGAQDEYRLPSDHEWSCAAGIGRQEKAAESPKSKSGKIKVYPWGAEWPPPKGAGNYSYELSLRVDDFEYTSPVGSFRANENGLYDMGGNVLQWCGDWYEKKLGSRVLRGSSWNNVGEKYLRSSYRDEDLPENRNLIKGFRCVLALSNG